MAKTPSEVQAKIDNKVWGNSNLLNSVVINRYTTTENEYGEDTPTFSSQETTNAIVLDYVSKAYKYDKSGLYNDSSLILLFRYDISMGENDTVTVYNDDYKLSRSTSIPYGDRIMIKRLFLKPL